MQCVMGLSTEAQIVLQIRESERINFSKEYSEPTVTLTDSKQKSQRKHRNAKIGVSIDTRLFCRTARDSLQIIPGSLY